MLVLCVLTALWGWDVSNLHEIRQTAKTISVPLQQFSLLKK